MTSARLENLIEQVTHAMKPGAEGADITLQKRMTFVIRHLLSAVEEIGLTESELAAICAFFDRVSATHEWRFLTHVFGVDTLVTELTHGGEGRPTADNVEGPLYRAGAPVVTTPARLMREDEPGERLLLSGQVVEAGTGRPFGGARIEAWQSSAAGAYAEDDPEQPEWNFRREVIADADGRYTIETVVPGCYEIGDLSGMACGDMMRKLGRHGMRPGHIHFKVAADGAKPLTTLLYFDNDPWVHDDSIFSVRDDVTLTLQPHASAGGGVAGSTGGSFQTASFDFVLEAARVIERV